MSNDPTYIKAVHRIVATANPSRVILFGSRATGRDDPQSDLDLVVILPEVKDRGKEMVRMLNAVRDVGIGVDLLVYSEAEVAERSNWSSSALYWALREGKVLYERTK